VGAALIGTPTAVDVTQGGKKLRRGIKVFRWRWAWPSWSFTTTCAKRGRQRGRRDHRLYPGFVHLPKVDAEFVQQLCAEQLITRRDRNGFPVREWQKMRERNEALDCYVYARAAASSGRPGPLRGAPLARVGAPTRAGTATG
jgi:phage terminase large subunit GpA-like protein